MRRRPRLYAGCFAFSSTICNTNCVFERPYWLERLRAAWRHKTVVWLMGVRRTGKTYLCRSIPDSHYFDCELASVRRELADAESFLAARRGEIVVLDEIHRLPDASQLLKIAADHFPETRLLATGSSTLGASARFRDTLVGRKAEIWLTPMVLADLEAFGKPDLGRRLLRGGLPPFFLAKEPPEIDFQEWLDSYWAKDVLELFRLERRHSFQRLFELLLAQSGGIFEATRFARACEISRPTVANYLAVLEATFVVHVVRPYAAGGSAEIVSAPKVYGFDTGFVAYHRGWSSLRPEDKGALWEHLVLNELHAALGRAPLHYWRSRHGNEIDFVVALRGRPPITVEAKFSVEEFEPANLRAFRNRYPEGLDFVVAANVERSFVRRYGKLSVRFVGLPELVRRLLLRPSRRIRST